MSKAYKGKSIELKVKISERNIGTEMIEFVDKKLLVCNQADLLRLALETLFEVEKKQIPISQVQDQDQASIKKIEISNEAKKQLPEENKVVEVLIKEIQRTENESLEIKEVNFKPQDKEEDNSEPLRKEEKLISKTEELSQEEQEELTLELLAMLGG